MALLFIDSCRSYSNEPAFLDKWDYLSYATSVHGGSLGSTSALRAGAYENYLVSDSFYVYKDILEVSTQYVGLTYKRVTDGTSPAVSFKLGGTYQVAFTFETDGTINARLGGVSGSILASSSPGIALVSKGYQHYEFMATISATTGVVGVKVNGISVLSGSSLDTENIPGGISRVQIAGNGKFTDIYFDDAQGHGICRVDGLLATGNGTYAQMTPSTGSNYECINERSNSNTDDDYVTADAVNEVDTYAFESLEATGKEIKCVALDNVCRQDDVGTVKFKPITRVNSSDYEGTEETVSTDYWDYQQIWEVNPDDSAAWEESDVNNAQFGLKRTV